MASPIETVHPEILTQIFQLIYDHCRQLDAVDDDNQGPQFRPDAPTFFSEEFMPSLYQVRRQFAGLRLLSRGWKDIADTFFFRDIVILITDFPGRDEYFNGEHRFLHSVYRRGFANLIRHVHIRVDVVAGPRGPEPSIFVTRRDPLIGESYGQRDRLLLEEYAHLIRTVLFSGSEARRRLFFWTWALPHYNDDISSMKAICAQVIDTFRELPQSCDVEFSLHDISLWLRDYEGMWATTLSRFCSENLVHLDLTCRQPISKQFFASLRRLKRLHLTDAWHSQPFDARLRAEDVTEAIALIPTLQELTLQKLPLLRVPTNLRRLFLMGPDDFFPEPEFLVTICQNMLLEDVRFVFSPVHFDRLNTFFSPNQLSILDHAQLPNLTTLQVCVVHIGSNLLTTFCTTLLRGCISLRELKMHGFDVTNEMVLGITSKYLRKLSLSGYIPFGSSAAEAAVYLPESANVFQWTTLHTLLKRNPDISDLHLSFGLPLPPLTYNDIDTFSSICPRLNSLELSGIIVDEETFDTLLEDALLPYRLERLYTCGSAAEDEFVKRILVVHFDECTGEPYFSVNLHHFKELKASKVRGTKKKRGKKARGALTK